MNDLKIFLSFHLKNNSPKNMDEKSVVALWKMNRNWTSAQKSIPVHFSKYHTIFLIRTLPPLGKQIGSVYMCTYCTYFSIIPGTSPASLTYRNHFSSSVHFSIRYTSPASLIRYPSRRCFPFPINCETAILITQYILSILRPFYKIEFSACLP